MAWYRRKQNSKEPDYFDSDTENDVQKVVTNNHAVQKEEFKHVAAAASKNRKAKG